MKITDRLKIAGRELIKANVGNAFKSLVMSESISPITYRGEAFGNNFWYFAPEYDIWATTGNNNSSLSYYENCPPFASIIWQKSLAFINGETTVVNSKGKAKEKEATGEQATKIKNLLLQPNPYQSGDHFEMQVYVNAMIFGYTIILPQKPNGFPNYDAQYLWALPGNMVEIEESEEYFYGEKVKVISKIWLNYKNKRTYINPDDVLIIRDLTPSFCSVAIPEPRSKYLKEPIQNIIGAMKSRGVMIKHRGPKYAISSASKDTSGGIPLSPEEKVETENAFKARYGLMPQQSQAIITSASINVQPIGFDVKQLGLFEEVQESSSMLCIGLGFPKFLAGLSDPTFNNQNEAKKSLYQDSIIPEAKSIYGQWSKWFGVEALNLRIEKDYSHLPVLQDDKMNLGRARLYLNQALLIEFQNNLITANQWLVANGLDPIPDGEQYYHQWIAAGKVFGVGQPSNTQDQNNQQNQGNVQS